MVTTIEKRCRCCSKPITVRLADHKRGWGNYCNKSCKATLQERKTGQHRAYLSGRGVSNLHPERLKTYGKDGYYLDENDTHPFSSEGLGQW